MLMLTSCKLGKLTGRRANKRVLRSIVVHRTCFVVPRPRGSPTEQRNRTGKARSRRRLASLLRLKGTDACGVLTWGVALAPLDRCCYALVRKGFASVTAI